MSSRILAVDWGERRLGIALSDPLGLTAQPLTVISIHPKAPGWGELQELIKTHLVGRVVVGIPLRTDGKESEKAKKVRAWIFEAKRHLAGIPFEEIDERFTTVEAQRLLREGGVKAKDQKKYVDKLAAAFILEHYLAAQSSPRV